MFTRNIAANLKQWKERAQRKPLILRGARQVGKTTAVNLFAQEFDQYLYLNLELNEERNLFNADYTFEEILAAIFLHKNIRNDKNKTTLIFIDEIQQSATAVAMLRYFYEQAPDLFVIAAGSLFDVLMEEGPNFPVGRVEYLFMYPLTFAEFLVATNEQEAFALLQQIPVPDYAHDKLLKLFHRYTLLGGMPEIIQHYSEQLDLVPLNSIYRNLLLSYGDDVAKYVRQNRLVQVVRHAIEQAPMEAGKRIKFQGFGHSNYGSRDMGEALRILEKALLLYLIYPTTSVNLPIVPNYQKSPRLQFLDTGLINYVMGLQKYYFSLADLNSFYQGVICEHIVGQELIAAGITPTGKINFWVREENQASAEVDFVVPYENYLIPVEVKAGKSGTLRSLHQFIDRTEHDCAIRLYAGNFKLEQQTTNKGKKYRLLNLPYYLVALVERYVPFAFFGGQPKKQCK